ncbi:MAG: helix-turn-helix domain-containing protein [Candidatus Tectomicrobia bacterium]
MTPTQLALTGLENTRPTQRQRVLAALRDGPRCGTEFLEMHIPRYGGRILELRKSGHTITNELCRKHQHYSRQTVYRLQ